MSQSLPLLQETLERLQADFPHYDPPCLRGVEDLLAKARNQRAAVQAPLLRRAAAMLNQYQGGCERAGREQSRVSITLEKRRQQLARRRSGAAVALRALQGELNSDAPGEMDAASPISALLRQQEFSLLSGITGNINAGEDGTGSTEPPQELRALRLLRSRQRHHDIEQRIDQAIQNAPQDPGPLNPQMLAIRALTNMRERSPAYLKQFVTYLDTLMWLEAQTPGDDSVKAKARKPARRKPR